jgi:3-hydroxybutyryl-CoA dehydrogenase
VVRQMAVIGAGVMGHGIAQLFAAAGATVRLHDVDARGLTTGLRAIDQSLALLVEEKALTISDAASVRARIHPTTDLDAALDGAELVTECIPEILELKRALFARIDRTVTPDVLVVSNTSTLPIVPLVEVLPHPVMPAAKVERVMSLMRAIGKRPVLLRRDVPGFVANRLQAALMREAFHLLEMGVADAQDIDTVMTDGPGVRWPFVGPLETADLGGLDVWRRVIENLAPELCRDERAPAPLRDRVERGDLGAKSGRGIYDYTGGRAAERLRRRDRALVRLARLKQRLGEPDEI